MINLSKAIYFPARHFRLTPITKFNLSSYIPLTPVKKEGRTVIFNHARQKTNNFMDRPKKSPAIFYFLPSIAILTYNCVYGWSIWNGLGLMFVFFLGSLFRILPSLPMSYQSYNVLKIQVDPALKNMYLTVKNTQFNSYIAKKVKSQIQGKPIPKRPQGHLISKQPKNNQQRTQHQNQQVKAKQIEFMIPIAKANLQVIANKAVDRTQIMSGQQLLKNWRQSQISIGSKQNGFVFMVSLNDNQAKQYEDLLLALGFGYPIQKNIKNQEHLEQAKEGVDKTGKNERK